MNYLVVLIANDIDDCPSILTAWEEVGVTGVTILASTGLGHLYRAGLSEAIPLMPSLHDIFESGEEQHRTLLSVVDGLEIVDKMVSAVQQIIGNLEDPHTGILFVVPVLQVYGLGKHRIDRSKE